jgi:hypothetical protein
MQMDQRTILTTAAVAAVPGVSRGAPAPGPNIVLTLAADMSSYDPGCCGCEIRAQQGDRGVQIELHPETHQMKGSE